MPPFGGDTTWANSALAYQNLSDTYKQMIQGLKVHFSLRDVLAAAQSAVELSDSPIGRLAASREAPQLSDDLKRKIRGNVHPLVRTHAVTGEKALYVDGAYAIGIEGMTHEESAPILAFLFEHITQPVFGCRLRWEPDMLVLWDNRLCVHQAYNDYQPGPSSRAVSHHGRRRKAGLTCRPRTCRTRSLTSSRAASAQTWWCGRTRRTWRAISRTTACAATPACRSSRSLFRATRSRSQPS